MFLDRAKLMEEKKQKKIDESKKEGLLIKTRPTEELLQLVNKPADLFIKIAQREDQLQHHRLNVKEKPTNQCKFLIGYNIPLNPG